jgi:hypothetical protein
MLAVGLPASAAGQAAGTTHDVVRATVEFTIPAGQCPNLAPGLSVAGTGDRVTVTDTTVRADQSSHMLMNDQVTGSATGSDGSLYKFFYGNVSTWDTPASGGPVQVKMYDLFLLQSKEAAAGNKYVLKNGFVWRWTYMPPADPFNPWPPSNFRELANFGQPVTPLIVPVCDPL